MEKYLTEKEVSQITGLSLASLRNSRSNGIATAAGAIPYSKRGASVRYAVSDVEQYMLAGRVVPGADYAEAAKERGAA